MTISIVNHPSRAYLRSRRPLVHPRHCANFCSSGIGFIHIYAFITVGWLITAWVPREFLAGITSRKVENQPLLGPFLWFCLSPPFGEPWLLYNLCAMGYVF